MGDDRSEVVEPMHRLDVDAGVGREVPMPLMYPLRSPDANADLVGGQ